MSHGEGGQGNTNASLPTGAPGVTHPAASTCRTLWLPGGHQKPLGHPLPSPHCQAAAWEGRGHSLGLVGLCRRRMRAEWVWDCKGMKTLDEADEGIGRDVAPRVATTTLGAWDGPETSQLLCPSNSSSHCHQQRRERTLCCRCPSPGVLTVPTLPSPALQSCCTPLLAAEIHVAHVHEASFCSWYHSAVAFGSSRISEVLIHRSLSLLLQGAGPGTGAGGVSARSPLACVMQKVRQDDNYPFQF